MFINKYKNSNSELKNVNFIQEIMKTHVQTLKKAGLTDRISVIGP